jgi:hypothetical protein
VDAGLQGKSRVSVTKVVEPDARQHRLPYRRVEAHRGLADDPAASVVIVSAASSCIAGMACG